MTNYEKNIDFSEIEERLQLDATTKRITMQHCHDQQSMTLIIRSMNSLKIDRLVNK